MSEDKNSIDIKLSKLKYHTSEKSHLTVNQEQCRHCKHKSCTYICPANVYTFDEKFGIIAVEYENCLECGACRYACDKGAIDWQYPEASCGVIYKFS